MKLYHELAEYYFSIEEGGRNINNDVLLIKSILKDNIKPSLLDLGCGTGEHLFHLNKLDVRCLGMDKSPDMLKIANLRFPDAAEFIWGDMSSFDYNQKFDIIISLFGSFNYMIDDNDVNRVLINTNRALKSKGMGLFEIWNSKPLIKIQHRPISHV